MAFKGGNDITLESNIDNTCTTTANPGDFLVYGTSGSGNAIGGAAGTVLKVTNPSGYVVAGCVSHEVVNIDETQYHLNFHKLQTNINQPVEILRKARRTINNFYPSQSPTKGDTAYLGASGLLTKTVDANGGTAATPKVGMFMGTKDADGYVTVDFNLPIV